MLTLASQNNKCRTYGEDATALQNLDIVDFEELRNAVSQLPEEHRRDALVELIREEVEEEETNEYVLPSIL